jgi:hypothetical protein
MSDIRSLYDETLSYFMTEYESDSNPETLENCIFSYLSKKYTSETIAEFLEKYLDEVRDQLVEEFNDRFGNRVTLRYRIVDDVGNQIAGIGKKGRADRLQFQDALNELTPSEFEALSAYVLRVFGCDSYWKTPETHDQGLDAFGYMPLLPTNRRKWLGAKPRIAFLAQAKHFKKAIVGSKDVREFVGSYVLAVYKIDATVDSCYQDLELLPFGPAALIFITTEEVPQTVKRLSLRSGIVVLSSDDLFDLLLRSWGKKPKAPNKQWVLRNLRKVIAEIPAAVRST